MSVFRTIRDMMRPYIRGNVRPDNFDNDAPATPLSGTTWELASGLDDWELAAGGTWDLAT